MKQRIRLFPNDTDDIAETYADILTRELPGEIVEGLQRESRLDLVKGVLIEQAGHCQEPETPYNVEQVQSALDEDHFVGAWYCFRLLENGPNDQKVVGGECTPRLLTADTIGRPTHFDHAARENGAHLWAKIFQKTYTQGMRFLGRKSDFKASFNIGANNLSQSGMQHVDWLLDTAKEHGADFSKIDLELQDFIPSLRPFRAELKRLTEEGITLSLDDFPRRQSPNLLQEAWSMNIPLSAIKFDGRMTATIDRNPGQLRQAIDQGYEHGISTFCFEGLPEHLLFEQTIENLHRLLEKQPPDVVFMSEGPAFRGNREE